MKLAPANGVNVCELVFLLDTDVFSTCFNFRTIYQAGGLQQVLATNIVVTSDNGKVVCCLKFTDFAVKSHSQRSCFTCILCFIYCTKIT